MVGSTRHYMDYCEEMGVTVIPAAQSIDEMDDVITRH
jgi:hypothetical protein